jgi:hypothetical protein
MVSVPVHSWHLVALFVNMLCVPVDSWHLAALCLWIWCLYRWTVGTSQHCACLYGVCTSGQLASRSTVFVNIVSLPVDSWQLTALCLWIWCLYQWTVGTSQHCVCEYGVSTNGQLAPRSTVFVHMVSVPVDSWHLQHCVCEYGVSTSGQLAPGSTVCVNIMSVPADSWHLAGLCFWIWCLYQRTVGTSQHCTSVYCVCASGSQKAVCSAVRNL